MSEVASESKRRSREVPLQLQCQMPPPGSQRKAYLAERDRWKEKHHSRLHRLKGIHQGERCFILGNAPSITEIDLEPLREQICFGVNSTHLLFKDKDWFPQYYAFTQRVRLLERMEEVKDLAEKSLFFYADSVESPSPHPLFSSELLEKIILLDQWMAVPDFVQRLMPLRNRHGFYTFTRLRRNAFSWDPSQGVWLGKSVIFTCAQLAAWMGCKEIILLGVDMDYSGPKTHFHGNQSWAPEQDYKQEVAPFFVAFRKALESRGIRFINASHTGVVDELERVPYTELI